MTKKFIYLIIVFSFVLFFVFNSPKVQDKLIIVAAKKLSQTPDFFENYDDDLKLVICGSRSPLPSSGRAETCVLVQAGNDIYLFDIGNGGATNLSDYRVPWQKLKSVFISHFHSDHFSDLNDIHLQTWIGGQRKEKLKVYGPEGIDIITRGFELANSFDYSYRTEHHGNDIAPLIYAGFNPIVFKDYEEIKTPTNDFKVIPFSVNHSPIDLAYGFKIIYKDRSIVISGDTIINDNLKKYSQDVDVLVHDVMSPHLLNMLSDNVDNEVGKIIFKDVTTYHAPVDEVGKLAVELNVGHLIAYHAVPAPTNRLMEKVFYRNMDKILNNWTPSNDGTYVILPTNSEEIIIGNL
tara:strand:+ start:1661 stop:2707 length:1047 start_codon:yes stop_codon:yes gene_type:complete